jgi:mitogen-activated protein kinase binding protein 1
MVMAGLANDGIRRTNSSIAASPTQDLGTVKSPKRYNVGDNRIMLSVKHIIGTTANNHASFCMVNDAVSYTAGAGAVVAQLSSDGTKLINQRFFCTSSKLVQQLQQQQQQQQQYSWLNESQFHSPGHATTARDSVAYISQLSIDDFNSSSPSGSSSPQRTSAKDKVKTTSCVALSNDNKLLAVGEMGHKPKILIYSLKASSEGTTVPLAVLSEHRFGVKFLAFSPCNRYLASIGTENDGFLHIWQVSTSRDRLIQLHSSNKCISIVNDLKWITSSQLMTSGVRQVRLWRLDNSGALWPDSQVRVLNGRNIVLNQFCGSIFVSIACLSNVIVLVTDRGELCTIQDIDEESGPLFTPRMVAGYEGIAFCTSKDNEILWLVRLGGLIQ